MMKKLIFIVFFALFLAACGSEDYSQVLEEQAQMIEEQAQIIKELQNAIVQQNEYAEVEEQQYTAWSAPHNFTNEDIIANLLANVDVILEVTGGEGFVLDEERIAIGSWYVWTVGSTIELSTHATASVRGDVLLTYVVWGGEIHWNVFAHQVHHGMWQINVPIQGSPRHFPRMGYVTARLYDFDDNTFEIKSYEVGQINAESWQEDVRRLMFEHTGIRLRDIWYDDRRLVVDLMPVEGIVADWGSTGGYIHTLRLIHSLASLPDVEEIKVLVGGEAGHGGSHFDFSEAFRVNEAQE